MRKLIVPLVILLILGLMGVGGYLLYVNYGSPKNTLTVWTLKGTESGIKAVADEFAKQNSNVNVKIVPVAEKDYEFRFLYALSAQKTVDGIAPPDVLVLPNETLPLHRSKLVAAPDGALDAGIHSYKPKPSPSATPTQEVPKGRSNASIIKQDYGPIATNDLVDGTATYGVPLNSDTLALYYNKSLISQPPQTWNALADATKRLTQKSGSTISRSGVALGDATVAHGLDVLSILMLQNGTTMVRSGEKLAGFNLQTTSGSNPGANALDYYTSFARSNKETYSWASKGSDSMASLKAGKAVMAFGYATDIATLTSASIGVAPLPQVDAKSPKTYGRYLTMGVTKQATNPSLAWKFAALFANPDLNVVYAKATKTLPARIDAAKKMTFDAKLQVFADQIGQATNWPKKEVEIADGALTEAINLVLAGGRSASDALDVAAKAYTTFLQRDSGLSSEKDIMNFWLSSDDSTDYTFLLADFLQDNKDVNRVIRTSVESDRFEWELLNAMAARLGPDIVALPSDRVTRMQHTIKALPVGTFKPAEIKASDSEILRRLFVPAIADDNLIGSRIYGMPMAVETLYLAYNVELFKDLDRQKNDEGDSVYNDNSALFSQGPTTWDDLALMAELGVSRNGATIERPFVALGTGGNVAHAADIYAAFVKQAGGDINNPDKVRSGIQLPISSSDKRVPGQEALDYILSFSDPKNANYSWNASQPNSIEAFADGKVMMAFIYPRDVAKIKARNPNLNIKFFPLPQIDTVSEPVDFASNFSFVVPVASRHSDKALKLIVMAASADQHDNAGGIKLNDNKPPTVERTGGATAQAFQSNTARSYAKGMYPDEVDTALVELLDKKQSIGQAANQLNQLLPKTIFAK